MVRAISDMKRLADDWYIGPRTAPFSEYWIAVPTDGGFSGLAIKMQPLPPGWTDWYEHAEELV